MDNTYETKKLNEPLDRMGSSYYYELIALGQNFFHYTMNELSGTIAKRTAFNNYLVELLRRFALEGSGGILG